MAFEDKPFSVLCGKRTKEDNIGVLLIACAHDHAVGLQTAHLSRREVVKYHTRSGHLFQAVHLFESGENLPDLAAAQVDLLDEEFLAGRVVGC